MKNGSWLSLLIAVLPIVVTAQQNQPTQDRLLVSLSSYTAPDGSFKVNVPGRVRRIRVANKNAVVPDSLPPRELSLSTCIKEIDYYFIDSERNNKLLIRVVDLSPCGNDLKTQDSLSKSIVRDFLGDENSYHWDRKISINNLFARDILVPTADNYVPNSPIYKRHLAVFVGRHLLLLTYDRRFGTTGEESDIMKSFEPNRCLD